MSSKFAVQVIARGCPATSQRELGPVGERLKHASFMRPRLVWYPEHKGPMFSVEVAAPDEESAVELCTNSLVRAFADSSITITPDVLASYEIA